MTQQETWNLIDTQQHEEQQSTTQKSCAMETTIRQVVLYLLEHLVLVTLHIDNPFMAGRIKYRSILT